MTTQTMVHPEAEEQLLEKVLVGGDLSRLTPAQRLTYLRRFCEDRGLDWISQPIQLLTLNGRLVAYITRGGVDQLCARHNVSLEIVGREVHDDILTVRVRARTPDGRVNDDVGAVPISGLRGVDRANAELKAITKGRRRAGLG